MNIIDLWLPILVSGVAVFIVSSIIHMALPIHKGDYKKLQNEEKVMEAMRSLGVTPGHFFFPCAGSMKEMGTPEMQEKMKRGPVGFMTVLPNGNCNIGKSLIQWFLLSLVIGVFTAYVCALTLQKGAEFGLVLRIASTLAILGYAFSSIQDSIWKGLSWSISLKFFIDGVVYGLTTGACFAWLWPAV